VRKSAPSGLGHREPVRLLVRWLSETGGLIALLLLLAVVSFILWQQAASSCDGGHLPLPYSPCVP
jgi:hypothetical protein